MSAADELRVVLAGAASGVDPGRLARRHGASALLRATPATLERMGALPALVDALRLARESDAEAYRRDLATRGIACATLSDDAYPDRLRELHDPRWHSSRSGRRPRRCTHRLARPPSWAPDERPRQ